MKYVVRRTSIWSDEDPRVPGAQKEMVTRHYTEVKGEPLGPNPVPERDELDEVWTIEIETLEQLHKLMYDVGEPVVLFNYIEGQSGVTLPMMEIYDDYRE